MGLRVSYGFVEMEGSSVYREGRRGSEGSALRGLCGEGRVMLSIVGRSLFLGRGGFGASRRRVRGACLGRRGCSNRCFKSGSLLIIDINFLVRRLDV